MVDVLLMCVNEEENNNQSECLRALMCAVPWTKQFVQILFNRLNNSGRQFQMWKLKFREVGPQCQE